MRKGCLLVSVVFLLMTGLLAQVQTGTISGTVRDKGGAVIPEATVSAKSLDQSVERSTTTNTQGSYTLLGLQPGQYELTIVSGNFSPYKQRVTVTVGGNQTVDASMGIGTASTTVEVSAESAGTEVNTQTQELSQVITPQQVAQLPSLTRNPYDFVALAGNVSAGDRSSQAGNPQTSGGGQNNSDRGVGYSINGQRSSGTELLMDGVENTNLFNTTIGLVIPQDAVQEFRIITNNFDAQYGRASGGVINVSTKSGTNAFHGSAWEFNRLSSYTANTYDNNAQRAAAFADGTCVNGQPCSVGAKGNYTRNEFGFTFGGPIVKNKLFFFESTEWLRVRSNASLFGYVPTTQLLAGSAANTQDYFNHYGAISPTFSSVVTAGDLAGMVNPTGAFANRFTDPTTPIFGLANYKAPSDAGGDNPQNTYDLVFKVDYNWNDKTQMFFRFGRENLLELPGSAFNSPYTQYNVGNSIVVDAYLFSLTHTFSNSLLSNTRVGFTRNNVAQQYNTTLQNTPTLFLFNGASLFGQAVTLPGFFDGTTSTGGLPNGGPQNTVQIFEDLAWTKNTHTVRFGGQYDNLQLNQTYAAYAQAVEQLGSSLASGLDNFVAGTLTNFQAAVNPQGKVPCTRNFQTLHLNVNPGCTLTLPATQPSFSRSYRFNDWALYAQDSWRLRPRFTFNYGVRYEHYGVQHNNNQQLDSNIYYGSGSYYQEQLRNAQIFLAPQSPIGGLWKPSWGTVAPRVGFAFDVLGDGTTSLRGGYGISYERNFGNVTFNMIQNPPNYASIQLHGVPVTSSNFGPLGGGSGDVPLPPVSPRMVDPNIRTAQTQFWSLALQRQVFRGGVVSVEYNGAHGVHLYDIKNVNELGSGNVYNGDGLIPDITGNCMATYGTSYCPSRTNAQFTSINNRGTSGYSHYNAMNIGFNASSIGRTGLQIVANYTWSHSQDNLSSTFSENSGGSNGVGNLGYLNYTVPQLDYGNSDFDIRNRFIFSAIWTEPYFKNGNKFEQYALGGWILTPIFTARSGIPFSVFDSTDSLNGTTQGPYGIPRYAPSSAITNYATSGGTALGPNNFGILTLPSAAPYALNGLLPGFEDFGPYPLGMTERNAFRAPGAWNFDFAVSKNFKLTERFNLEFRAESFDLFNHHNMYVNGFVNDVAILGPGPLVIQGKKGGLGAIANNGNHDERRFGQFALRLQF